MRRFIQAICAIGAQREVECAAPTQIVSSVNKDEKDGGVTTAVSTGNAYTAIAKARRLDRWLDNVVAFSGSEAIFFLILASLLVWAFLGIPFGGETDWQVGISDTQAILNLLFDSFLMRQQLNAYHQILIVSCCLRSRSASHKRMLRAFNQGIINKDINHVQPLGPERAEFADKLPSETLLGRVSTSVSNFLGHIVTVTGFWVCIFIWIGFGQYCGWSSTWLFYINSATSALMVFILAFLANIRERHSDYTAKCLQLVYTADSALELRLRSITGDIIPNQSVVIPPPQVNRIQRWINFYADLVGTLLGILILFIVLVIWIAIGPALSFNSNWWLLIGTYAGLIGMNDGFVLRNIYHKIAGYEEAEFDQQTFDDMDMLAMIGITQLAEEKVADNSLSCRISIKMGKLLSHEWTVVMGVFTIIGLIIGSSALGWSITGQLLSNVPPSIIESFFTMILITGHNIGDAKRRVDLHNIYLRRLKLISYLDTAVQRDHITLDSKQ
ncbi:MAG: low-affinity Fe(2+) transport protein [Trizodia sp. TS-e1964]|nr:MAG: low-affinity Fe(2+) transport protein [Trizodia sp. TS-e1964]